MERNIPIIRPFACRFLGSLFPRALFKVDGADTNTPVVPLLRWSSLIPVCYVRAFDILIIHVTVWLANVAVVYNRCNVEVASRLGGVPFLGSLFPRAVFKVDGADTNTPVVPLLRRSSLIPVC